MSAVCCTPLHWWNELPNCVSLKTMPDMCILVGNKSIPVHKSILNIKSNVFATMLNSDMSESMTNQLYITDFSYDVVMSFLRCIYDENCVDAELTHNGEQLLVIANKYEVVSLFQKAEKYLISTLTVDNVISLLCLADLHNSQLLKSVSMQILVNSISFVLQNVNLSEVLNASLCNEFILFAACSNDSSLIWRETTDDTICPKDCKLIVSLNPNAVSKSDGIKRNNRSAVRCWVPSDTPCGVYDYRDIEGLRGYWFEKRGKMDEDVESFGIQKDIHYPNTNHWFLIADSQNNMHGSKTYFEVERSDNTTVPIGVFGEYVIKCYQKK